MGPPSHTHTRTTHTLLLTIGLEFGAGGVHRYTPVAVLKTSWAMSGDNYTGRWEMRVGEGGGMGGHGRAAVKFGGLRET